MAPRKCRQCDGTGFDEQGFIEVICHRCRGRGIVPAWWYNWPWSELLVLVPAAGAMVALWLGFMWCLARLLEWTQ
jgi:hypothetical protein